MTTCKMLALILCFSFVTTVVQGQVETKIVNLNQGAVRGYKDPEYDVFAFRGVPYATEPKGRDKFKAPLPPTPWTGTLDAVSSNNCPQFLLSFMDFDNINCLVANIFIPKTDAVNLPVVIFIHGGGFFGGGGDWQQPITLVNSKRVVAVTINYRLGVHGFLCLGTENVPGNAGMKDQVAAIRWVKENIAKFGGNPNSITLAGSSGGAMSVNLHLLSKMSRGLFQKAIPDSGSSISPFTPQQDPMEDAKKFASRLSSDLNVDDLKALEEFYLQASINELSKPILEINPDYSLMFSPCIERDTGTERFLEASPYSIIKSGNYSKLPKLEGFATFEGLLNKLYFDKFFPEMNADFSNFLPTDLHFESKEQKDEVARTVKRFYFGEREIGPDTAIEFVKYFSDIGFTYSILRSVKLHLETGLDTIYLYEYAFVDDNTSEVPYTNIKGAEHASQTEAIYDTTQFKNTTKEFEQMKKSMQELYLNFITDGQPVLQSTDSVPAWPKVNKFNSPYMLLNQTSSLQTSMLQSRFELWDKIYEKHYHEPQPPSNSGLCVHSSLITVIVLCVVIIMIK